MGGSVLRLLNIWSPVCSLSPSLPLVPRLLERSLASAFKILIECATQIRQLFRHSYSDLLPSLQAGDSRSWGDTRAPDDWLTRQTDRLGSHEAICPRDQTATATSGSCLSLSLFVEAVIRLWLSRLSRSSLTCRSHACVCLKT